MKFGFRTPSLKKRIAARTSWKRVVRHSLGIKAPRGWGWLTNPKKAAYNRVYSRTTVDPVKFIANVAKPSSGKAVKSKSGSAGGVAFLLLILVGVLVAALSK